MHPHPLIDQVASAMSAATLRHQVIASNIANRDTPDYQRLQVSFDRALESTATRSGSVVPESAAIKPSLEDDMVSLSSNTMSYQALSRALSRYLAILSTISSSNRG